MSIFVSFLSGFNRFQSSPLFFSWTSKNYWYSRFNSQGLLSLLIFLKIIILNMEKYSPLYEVSAPGKVILCGQHAVVYGKDALAMPINLRCYAKVFVSREEQLNRFDFSVKFLQPFETSHEIIVNDLKQSLDFQAFSESEKLKSEQRLKLEFKTMLFLQKTKRKFCHNQEFVVVIDSKVPIGKCLGSSAAFNTVFAATLFLMTGDIPQTLEKSLETINDMSKLFESVEHGTPSGIDNFVSTFGGLVLFNNSKSPPFLKMTDGSIFHKLNEEIKIVLVDSGLEKNTKKAVGIVRQNYNKDNKYQEIINQIGQFSEKIIQLLSEKSGEGLDWKKKFMTIIQKNHFYLRELGVSCPQIEKIIQNNSEQEKVVFKVTGAGMGGYVLGFSTLSQPLKINGHHILETQIESQGLQILQIKG